MSPAIELTIRRVYLAVFSFVLAAAAANHVFFTTKAGHFLAGWEPLLFAVITYLATLSILDPKISAQLRRHLIIWSSSILLAIGIFAGVGFGIYHLNFANQVGYWGFDFLPAMYIFIPVPSLIFIYIRKNKRNEKLA